jgi:ADP-ribose pyrophosphatase YjhB (NUDIX family)
MHSRKRDEAVREQRPLWQTLRARAKKLGFSGAGVVLVRAHAQGGDEILVGQRAYRPGRGVWSIPGGGRKEGEDLRACAMRETAEEIAGRIPLRESIGVSDTEQQSAPYFEWRVPFFEWRTFLVRLDAAHAPGLVRSHEFRALQWVRPGELPAPSHRLLRAALRHFRKLGLLHDAQRNVG